MIDEWTDLPTNNNKRTDIQPGREIKTDGRETDRQRQTETQTNKDRQADRQTNRQTNREKQILRLQARANKG